MPKLLIILLKLLIILIISLTLFIGYVPINFIPISSNIYSLLQNLSVELFGLFITYFVIERIINTNTIKKLEPLKIAAIRDLIILLEPCRMNWQWMIETCRKSNREAKQHLIEQIKITNNIFEIDYTPIIHYLNLQDAPPVYPKRSWITQLVQHKKDTQLAIESYISQYASVT